MSDLPAIVSNLRRLLEAAKPRECHVEEIALGRVDRYFEVRSDRRCVCQTIAQDSGNPWGTARLIEDKAMMDLFVATIAALPALLVLVEPAQTLQQEIDEALLLTESCSNLKQMAAACIEGAALKLQTEAPAGDREAVAAEELFDRVFGPSGRGWLTVRDIAYAAFMRRADGKNPDDGGPCDWFNDTLPLVEEGIAKIRETLSPLLSPPAHPAEERAVVEAIFTEREMIEIEAALEYRKGGSAASQRAIDSAFRKIGIALKRPWAALSRASTGSEGQSGS